MLGINIGTAYVAMSLGPFLGGLLTDHFGWRSIFLMTVPGGIVIIVVTLTKLRQEWAEAEGEAFDYLGSAAYGLTLAALIYGFTALPSTRGLTAILLGFSGIVFFVKWERSVRHPMLDVELFTGNRLFAFSNLAGVINYIPTYSVTFLLSLYLQTVRGLSARGAGLLLVSQPLVQGVFTLLTGRLSDRIQPRLVASTGMGLTALAVLLFSFLSVQTPLFYIVCVLALLGLSVALFAVPNANALMASVDSKSFGVASGMLVSTGTVGQLLSMGLTSLVFALYFGRLSMNSMASDHTVPLLQSLKLLFMIFFVVALLGVLVSFLRGNVHTDK
jgi:MFS family permease